VCCRRTDDTQTVIVGLLVAIFIAAAVQPQGLYRGMDYGPICSLVLRWTTSPPPKLEPVTVHQIQHRSIRRLQSSLTAEPVLKPVASPFENGRVLSFWNESVNEENPDL